VDTLRLIHPTTGFSGHIIINEVIEGFIRCPPLVVLTTKKTNLESAIEKIISQMVAMSPINIMADS